MVNDNRSEHGLTSTLREGARFVVRHRLAPGGSHTLTDTVGEVVALDAARVTLRTRRAGDVTVPREDITTVKEIPPRPGRRGRPHQAVSVDDLERLAVDGWAPAEQRRLGDWILRAAHGYTGRANSALAVGHCDRTLDEALAAVASWYAERHLPALLHVPLSPGFAPADDPLVTEAEQHGWEWFQLTEFLTASTEEVLAAAPPPTERVSVDKRTTLTTGWWALADDRMREHETGARQVLTGSPDQVFFTLAGDGAPRARARLALAHGWGGLFAVATRPEDRGHGYASMLLHEAARAARERGVLSLYLQVSADNAPAVRLYERMGFTRHHQYVYLRERPGTARDGDLDAR